MDDTTNPTSTVIAKIITLEPENASKIIDYFQSQDIKDCDLIRLAFGPNTLIQEFCRNAKYELGLLPKGFSLNSHARPFNFHDKPSSSTRNDFLVLSRNPNNPALYPSLIRENPNFNSSPFHDGSSQQQQQQLSFSANDAYLESDEPTPSEQQRMIAASFMKDFVSPMSNRQGSGQFGVKGGFGSPSEQQRMTPAQFMRAFGSPMSNRQGSGQFGNPLSPSLTSNTLGVGGGYCHSSGRQERKDSLPRKIYLKFRPDSSFTDEDVSTYFSKFGAVENVEIPYQLIRTFGFVTFANVQTVRTIVARGNPHFISCSIVYVKPYMEKDDILLQKQGSEQFGEEGGYYYSSSRHEIEDAVSKKIYLTFPSESSFTDEDVSTYFSDFGPVEDVRIPYQQQRVYGFVTFAKAETVRTILGRGNPHFICDSRVLVKPYKEKGKILQKRQQQQLHQLLERGNYSPSSSPSGMDSRDLYECRLGPRMFSNKTQEMLRRKTEQADVQLPHMGNISTLHHQRSPSTGSPAHFPSRVMEGDSDRGEKQLQQVATSNEERGNSNDLYKS